jgi:hypothetical protein
MIKLESLMPDVAKKIAEDEEHRRGCTDRQCERCGRVDVHKRRRAVAESFRQQAIEHAISRVPPAYAGAELDAGWLVELVGPETIARAHEVVGVPRVAFLGPPGAGKSSLAAALFKASVRAETAVLTIGGYRWVSSHKLAKARAGQPLGEGEAPLVEACMGAKLLVLDELGGEDPRYASAVAEVLFERHEQELPTWVTTGVGSKEIATRYGGGIARRIFEGAAVFRLGPRR